MLDFCLSLYVVVYACVIFPWFTIYWSILILNNCIIIYMMTLIIYKTSLYIHISNKYLLLLLIILLSSSTHTLKRSIIFNMIFFWHQIFRFIKYKLFTLVPISLDIYDVCTIYTFIYEYVGLTNKYYVRVLIVNYHTIYILPISNCLF